MTVCYVFDLLRYLTRRHFVPSSPYFWSYLMINGLLLIDELFFFWHVAFLLPLTELTDFLFFSYTYGRLNKDWKMALKTLMNQMRRQPLRQASNRVLMNEYWTRRLERNIVNYNTVSEEFDKCSKANSFVYFFFMLLTVPCNCLGLYLIIYLKSSFPNWFMAVSGTVTVTICWIGSFVLCSSCNHQADAPYSAINSLACRLRATCRQQVLIKLQLLNLIELIGSSRLGIYCLDIFEITFETSFAVRKM